MEMFPSRTLKKFKEFTIELNQIWWTLLSLLTLNQARFYQASAHRAITMIKKGAHHKCHSSSVVQYTAFLTSHCFHLWHKVYSYCTFKKYFLLFTRSSNVYFIILVLGKSSKVHIWNNKMCIWKYFLMFLELINIFELLDILWFQE
jgi:hypothetical protein